MSIVMLVCLGMSVGITACLLAFTRDAWDWFVSIAFGVLGAGLGAGCGRAIGLYREDEPAGLVASVFGAGLLVFALHATTQRRRWREGREIR